MNLWLEPQIPPLQGQMIDLKCLSYKWEKMYKKWNNKLQPVEKSMFEQVNTVCVQSM